MSTSRFHQSSDLALMACACIDISQHVMFHLQELQQCLDEACCTIRKLERQLHCQQEGVQHVGSCLQRMAEVYGHCKTSFDQGLTRLAHYEQRLTLASRTLNSVKGKICAEVCQSKYGEGDLLVAEFS